MTHPRELISAYLDGELTAAEVAELNEHLSWCGRCAVELEELQQVRAAVRSLPLLEPPVDLAMPEEVDVVPLSRRRGLWVGTAAAVLVLVMALAALLAPPPPSMSVEDLSSRFGARASLDPAFGPAKVVAPSFGGETE